MIRVIPSMQHELQHRDSALEGRRSLPVAFRSDQSGVISLKSCRPIGQGAFRRCYLHPRDGNLCIKVAHGRHAERPSYEDPNLREVAEYERLKRLGAPVHQFGPRIFGFVHTDIGPGLCVELLRGPDGGLIRNVRSVWKSRVQEGRPGDDILDGIRKFAAFCVKFKVLAACAAAENIGIARRHGRVQVVAFDFKGHSSKEFFPVSTYVPYLRARKIARRFDRLIADLQRSAR